jgi:hypothetical protein
MTDFKDLKCSGVDWMKMEDGRIHKRDLMNTVTNIQLPYKAENMLSSGETVRLSASWSWLIRMLN